ncbi:MAG TPA: hypothetical protein VER98_03970 [Terriglobia bacterium]|nr:hypothetical protein [Terriglobia bacterium]
MPFYPASGKATLLNANGQVLLFNADRPGAGSPNKASIAVLLARGQQSQAGFPFHFAVELSFSGSPGTFEVDIQGSETDTDASYCLLGTAITTVNSSNYARFEGVNLYPRFVRAFVKTLGNDVNVTAIATR